MDISRHYAACYPCKEVCNMKKKVIPVIIPGTGVGPSAINYKNADPFGSYTGRPEDPDETPVQDADDL